MLRAVIFFSFYFKYPFISGVAVETAIETVHAFVKPQEKVAEVICPHCRRRMKLPLDKVSVKFRPKIKCYCHGVFAIVIESRDQFRKLVDLPGFCDILIHKTTQLVDSVIVTLETKFVNTKLANRIIPNCRVVDLSRHGLRLQLDDTMRAGKGDILRVRFHLDNSARTEITQECEVRHVIGRQVGCRMLKDNVSIGFYLIG